MIRLSYPKALVLYFGQVGNSGPDMVVLHGLFVQAKIGAVFYGRLKKTFRSVRWTHGIVVVVPCGFNVLSGNGVRCCFIFGRQWTAKNHFHGSQSGG